MVLMMTMTAHIGTIRVASIAEILCIEMISVCAQFHTFTIMCMISYLSDVLHKVCLQASMLKYDFARFSFTSKLPY